MANRDVPDLAALDDAERDELADVYLDLLRRLDRYYQAPDGSPTDLPYIAGWHHAPVRQGATSPACTYRSCLSCGRPAG